MLRANLAAQEALQAWRVSVGSAAVLHLCTLHMDAAPTTAYVMLGERCARRCAFCTQARDSQTNSALLSRITWPPFRSDQVLEGIIAAFREGRLQRVCLQTTVSPHFVQRAEKAIQALSAACSIPISVSIALCSLEEIGRLLAAGAERVTIALDAASERVATLAKPGLAWEETRQLLYAAAERYPGHIGTHLIAGLGETEQELITCLAGLYDHGLMVGLFAFTPIPGTRMAHHPPPDLASYRALQATRWLLTRGLVKKGALRYDEAGRLISLGLTKEEAARLLEGGEAFCTAGCAGCNRP
ncbi:MAG: radical SAM protein, partial [Chloroflexi bacterium]|nr:radical SAM protein [Chloroflexota bacterium]